MRIFFFLAQPTRYIKMSELFYSHPAKVDGKRHTGPSSKVLRKSTTLGQILEMDAPRYKSDARERDKFYCSDFISSRYTKNRRRDIPFTQQYFGFSRRRAARSKYFTTWFILQCGPETITYNRAAPLTAAEERQNVCVCMCIQREQVCVFFYLVRIADAANCHQVVHSQNKTHKTARSCTWDRM